MRPTDLTHNTNTPKEQSTTKALLYIRARDDTPAAEAESVKLQRRVCRKKTEQLDTTIDAEYVDTGASANDAERPGLVALLKRLEQKPGVDYVIVHRIDRLCRNLASFAEVQLAIASANTRLVSCSEEIDQAPSAIFIRRILSIVGEFHSREMGEASRRGRLAKARRGEAPGRTPTGYRNVSTHKHARRKRSVEIDPEQGPVVARAFDTYAKAASPGGRSATKRKET